MRVTHAWRGTCSKRRVDKGGRMNWQRRTMSLVMAVAGLWSTAAWAQEALGVPAGRRLPLAFETRVSSSASRAGDPVVARTTQNVRDAQGAVVIPSGSKLHGHVTAADPGGRMKGRAHLAVAFDRVVV